METIERAEDLLSEAGYQLTPQRRKVLELCMQAEGHFTAEDLYELDRSDQHDLSRATIYNTLHVLVELGFLRELSDIGSSRHYEIRHHLHPHARCRVCGALIDIPVDLEEEVHSWNIPFEIETVRMTVDGLCRSCQKKH